MISPSAAYVPTGLITLGAIALWLWILGILKPGRAKDAVRGFGVGMLIALGMIGVLHGADDPIAHLSDSTFGSGTPVYAFVDPVTHRRFLVIEYGPQGAAVVEATPAPVPVVLAPPVQVDPAAQARISEATRVAEAAFWAATREPAPPASVPPMSTTVRDPWDYAVTYAFGQAQIAKGWKVMTTTEMMGRTMYHIRRPNPNYVPPDPSKLSVEAPVGAPAVRP